MKTVEEILAELDERIGIAKEDYRESAALVGCNSPGAGGDNRT